MIRSFFRLLILALAGGAGVVVAAEPVPAVPPVKTLTWTASFVSTVKIPTVLFENEPVGSAMDYLLQAFPPEFRPEIEFGRLKPEKVKPVRFTGRNVTLLYAVSMIAEQLDANVLLEPGKIVLVPKEEKKEPEKAAEKAPEKGSEKAPAAKPKKK